MVVARKPFTMSWSQCAQRGVRVQRTRKQRPKSTCRARNHGGKRERVVHAPVTVHRRSGEVAASCLVLSRAITPRKFPNQFDAWRCKRRRTTEIKPATP